MKNSVRFGCLEKANESVQIGKKDPLDSSAVY